MLDSILLVDSHCHLDALNYEAESIDERLALAKKNHVHHLLSVATTLSSYQKMKADFGAYPMVSLSCGVHPLNLKDEPFSAEALLNLAKEDEVVALGETGLDYYYEIETKIAQQEAFIAHIDAGKFLQKPIIVHTRSAKEDTLALIRNEQAYSGVLHCFTEDKAMAKALLDLGFYLSFSGMITFKNAEALREVAKYVPLDRLLIETDSPYLAPVPYRGKENQPAYVNEVAKYMATLKGVELEKLAQQTTLNFSDLFKVNPIL